MVYASHFKPKLLHIVQEFEMTLYTSELEAAMKDLVPSKITLCGNLGDLYAYLIRFRPTYQKCLFSTV